MTSAAPAAAAPRRRVRLFGLDGETDVPFRSRLGAGGDGPPDLAIALGERPPAGTAPAAEPVYRSPVLLADGRPALTLHPAGAWDLLHAPGRAGVYCGAREIRVVPEPAERAARNGSGGGPGSGSGSAIADGAAPAGLPELEVLLLGTVLAFWLERAGWPVLHAAAVEVDGRAVAFLAGNRGGKSSLAAQLVASGAPLVSDDLLPVAVEGGAAQARPGYPQMRLWPDAAAVFAPPGAALERILPDLPKLRLPVGAGGLGSFCDRTLPLARLYLPERREDAGGVAIEPVAPARAVLELVARSFVPRLVSAAGLERRRLATLAAVVERVPVRTLRYPSGYAHLPTVAGAVLADLSAPH